MGFFGRRKKEEVRYPADVGSGVTTTLSFEYRLAKYKSLNDYGLNELAAELRELGMESELSRVEQEQERRRQGGWDIEALREKDFSHWPDDVIQKSERRARLSDTPNHEEASDIYAAELRRRGLEPLP